MRLQRKAAAVGAEGQWPPRVLDRCGAAAHRDSLLVLEVGDVDVFAAQDLARVGHDDAGLGLGEHVAGILGVADRDQNTVLPRDSERADVDVMRLEALRRAGRVQKRHGAARVPKDESGWSGSRARNVKGLHPRHGGCGARQWVINSKRRPCMSAGGPGAAGAAATPTLMSVWGTVVPGWYKTSRSKK